MPREISSIPLLPNAIKVYERFPLQGATIRHRKSVAPGEI